MSFKADLTGVIEIADALDEVARMSAEFNAERSYLSSDLEGDIASPYFRRTFVRLECARLEGMTAMMKRVALVSAEFSGAVFSKTELEVLNDDRFLSTIKNCDICWRCFTRSVSPNEPKLPENRDWNAFEASVKIRNRVVHPKKPADLDIAEDELICFLDGLKWFHSALEELIDKAAKDFRHLLRAKKVYKRETPKLGRNDRCSCGSGKKFKNCHGVELKPPTIAE